MWKKLFGRDRGEPDPGIPDFGFPPVDETLMIFLQRMYSDHGATARRVGNWIVVDGGAVLARAAVFNERAEPGKCVFQADFVAVTQGVTPIIESFAGFGKDRHEALLFACKGFQDSSFHPIFNAILKRECTHVDVEHWVIGGVKRKVTMGMLRVVGAFPAAASPMVVEAVEDGLKNHDLPAGTHAVRLFYSHNADSPPVVEFLIDGEPVTGIQDGLRQHDWPGGTDFYSVRLFLIVEDV